MSEYPVTDGTLLRVRILHRDGHAVLVQWMTEDGTVGRAIVPASELVGDSIPPHILQAGIPGGEKWSDLEGVDEDLEQAFYQRGIWEPEDMLQFSHLAQQAIQRAIVVPLKHSLLKYAKAALRRNK